jgi:four helix bundle protein
LDAHRGREPLSNFGRPVFQHRVLEDTEVCWISDLWVLQNSVLNPAVHGKDATAESLLLKDDTQAPPPPPRDLLERTALFAEAIIRFAKKVPRGPTTNRLIDQLVGAGSSIAANYCEADDAVSGKDFKQSIGTCRKESKETMLFLRRIATAEEGLASEARTLWREAKELNLIFGAIWRK